MVKCEYIGCERDSEKKYNGLYLCQKHLDIYKKDNEIWERNEAKYAKKRRQEAVKLYSEVHSNDRSNFKSSEEIKRENLEDIEEQNWQACQTPVDNDHYL